VIASFGDKATEALYHGRPSKDVRRVAPDVKRAAFRKLDMLNAARSLADLRSLPGNRLEVLRGDLAGRHSIRVNDQWRIVFRWEGSDAHEVRLGDYHDERGS
jgi:proteic killer suppression protein